MTALTISRAEAAAELLRRRRARASLVDFSQAVDIPGAPVSDDPDEWMFKPIESSVSKHHIVIMQALQECYETDYGRLMILAPPGSAKSTYAGVVGPAWLMGRYPGSRLVMTSYAEKAIIRASKRTRQLVMSPEYRAIFGSGIRRGSSGADEWEMDNGSGLVAAGLLGGINSTRADMGLLDDIVAGREEADSETQRNRTRDAYDDDFMTRLKPKASIVFINTRWHLKDQMGMILPENYDGRSGFIQCRDGQVWRVLNIQAKCEHADDPVGREIGEYLWPEWFGPKHWAIYEPTPENTNINMRRRWNSLYQQRPTDEEGTQFKREWFKRHSSAPKNATWWVTGDFAVTDLIESDDPDWTALGTVGIDTDEMLYFQDFFHEQVDPDVSLSAFVRLARRRRARQGVMEKGVIKNALGSALRRKMKKLKWWIAMEYLATTADKTAMAAAFRALASNGQVSVAEGPMGDRFIDQLCSFPRGADDLVDMAGLIGRIIDKLHAPDDESAGVAKRKSVKPLTGAMYKAMEEADEAEEAQKRGFYR